MRESPGEEGIYFRPVVRGRDGSTQLFVKEGGAGVEAWDG